MAHIGLVAKELRHRRTHHVIGLGFEPVDFLEKPVPTTGGSFTAQIVKKGAKDKAFTLKAEDFVHHEVRSNAFSDIQSLSEEDLLFQEAEGVSGLNFRGLGNAVLHQLNGAVPAAQETTLQQSKSSQSAKRSPSFEHPSEHALRVFSGPEVHVGVAVLRVSPHVQLMRGLSTLDGKSLAA